MIWSSVLLAPSIDHALTNCLNHVNFEGAAFSNLLDILWKLQKVGLKIRSVQTMVKLEFVLKTYWWML